MENEKIFDIINEIFIEQAGPVGQFICDEARETWQANSPALNFASLRHYIKLLHDELPTDKNKQEFVESLRANPSTKQIISN